MDALTGAVVIGRNEGERLVRCLRSARACFANVVYVDSGSSDGSPERAEAEGVEVVALDPGRPFTAARGRNAGFARLAERLPGLRFVQFVDGDCELDAGWPAAAEAFLEANPEVAIVCGRRREREPEASPYNRLADLEWDTPAGEAEACGGDALIRAAPLQAVGGYDEGLIAGEDPDLSYRIRRAGHRIVRLDREMTLHDAAMARFPQWWRRQTRAGHAYAELAARHRDPQRVRRVASFLFWGAAMPALALCLAPVTGGASLLLLALLPLLGVRVYRDRRQRSPRRDAALYAAATVFGKTAESQGAWSFAWNRIVRRRERRLIEYKDPAGSGSDDT